MTRPKLVRSMLIWTAFVSLATGILILFQSEVQITALEKESAALQRLVSQRVGQHDAHMTSLSAIATDADLQRSDLFLGVAATISRFLPRIDEVQLVSLNAVDDIVGTQTLEPSKAAQIRLALRHVKEMLKSEADQRRVSLNVEAPGKPVEVNADQVEMEQVFIDLIRDALSA